VISVVAWKIPLRKIGGESRVRQLLPRAHSIQIRSIDLGKQKTENLEKENPYTLQMSGIFSWRMNKNRLQMHGWMNGWMNRRDRGI
jgi:hypothetical protein